MNSRYPPKIVMTITLGVLMQARRFRYAYRKVREWHVGSVRAGWLALRYGLTGDTGRFSSHGGWRVSRLRVDRDADS